MPPKGSTRNTPNTTTQSDVSADISATIPAYNIPSINAHGESVVDTRSISSMLAEVLSSQKRMEASQLVLQEKILRMESSQEKIHNRVDSIYANIQDIQAKQTTTDKTVLLLQKKSNLAEQHTRGFSLRIFNLFIPVEISKDSLETSKLVYANLLAPILNIAVGKGRIDYIPPLLELIDYAHVLPSKVSNSTPPVIVRLKSRLLRDQIFKCKPEYYRSNPSCKSSIFEDLTSDNFKQLRSIQADDKVLKAWTQGGRCKFINKSNPTKVLTADPPYSC